MSRSDALTVTSNGRVEFNGQELFAGSREELFEKIDRLSADGGAHLLVTLNVDHVIGMTNGTALTTAYRSAALVTADGMPVVMLARLLGERISRLAGSDLLEWCAAESAGRKWRVAMLGGASGVSRRAAAQLRRRYPASEVQGIDLPANVENASRPEIELCIASLAEFDPTVVFLCLGSPKQELWFDSWKEELPAAVYIGAGAAADFAAGQVVRSPVFLQAAGLEWLWRLAIEPRRLWRRYLMRGPQFVTVVAKSVRLATQARRRQQPATRSLRPD